MNKVFGELQEALEFFEEKVDAAMEKRAHTALANGRLTLMEFLLMQCLMNAKSDAPNAVELINYHVKTFDAGNIKANMLHPCIWRSCQRLCQGKDFN